MSLVIEIPKAPAMVVKLTEYGRTHNVGLAPGLQRYGAVEFWKDFAHEGEKGKAPLRPPSGEDFGIAQRILAKYGIDKSKKYVVAFWSLYSDPIYDGSYQDHPMRLFMSKIPDIRMALGEED